MITEKIRKDWDHKIEFLRGYGQKYMNDWEKDFIDSIHKLRQSGGDITLRQSFVLVKLYKFIEGRIG
jgi:hypothetical protein